MSLLPGQTLELFFLAGQSNADGSNSYYRANGDPSKGPGFSAANASFGNPYAGVQYAFAHSNFNNAPGNYRYLQGNLGALRPADWGMMGPELSLGRELDALHTNDVALLKYTSPGSSLNSHWRPDRNVLYQDMLSFYQTQIGLLSGSYSTINFNAFFWHQGESDSGSTYEADFLAMFQQLRADLSPNLTGVMGLISENFDPGNSGNTPRSSVTAVNGALNSLATNQSYLATTGSLTDIPLHDFIHFDANGQVTHGQRMALAYENNFLNAVPEPSSIGFVVVASLAGLARRERGQ